MACYHPAYVQRRVNKTTGEIYTKWLGYLDASEERGLLARDFSGNKSSDGTIYQDHFQRFDMIQVPCGKCIGCRMDYSRSWADRMTYHQIGKDGVSWFITLTYNEDDYDALRCDNFYNVKSLDYSHTTDFIKKLRNKYRDAEIDYFYSGEYGDNSFRSHYHLILYNVLLSDLVFHKLNNNGDPIYLSETLSDMWSHGFVTVSPFSWRGAAYTAAYVEKKLDGRRLCEYTALGLEPEKARMSRRPGLAYDYYIENADALWKNYGLNVGREVNSSGKLGMPRYFRKLAEKTGVGYDEFLAAQTRQLDRTNVLRPLSLSNSSFDLSNISQMLQFEENEILSRKVKKLI